jgi:hypothetical protein
MKEKLAKRVAELRVAIVKKSAPHMERINNARAKGAAAVADLLIQLKVAEDNLLEWVKDHPAEFVSPKSNEMDGVKFGYKKTPDSLITSENTVELILQSGLDTSTTLRTTVEPVLDALKQLPPEKLAEIGCKLVSENKAFVSVSKAVESCVAALKESAKRPHAK